MKSMKFALACGALALIASSPASAGIVFGSASYNSSITLSGATTDTAAGAAFSNGSYYLGYGGSLTSPIVQTDANGAQTGITSPTPGIDFRSVFTNAAGDVFARGFFDNTIYQQGAFGDFTAGVTLAGSLDAQSQVVLTSDGLSYVGNDNGTLKFWDLTGAFTHSVALGGGFNTGYPQGRAVSIFGNYALNYNAGVLSAYSLSTGALVDQTTLNGAANGFNSLFGQSYANGYFFVTNEAGDQWKGYQLSGGNAVPEPATWALMIGGFGLAGSALRRRRALAA
jgi:PEP-CTERM motif